jgi:tartronate-semialdehyde synthase
MPLSGSLVPSLAVQGVGVTFGLPGAHTVPLYGALARRLRHLLVRHERGATFMADGYARGTGRLGVVLTTTGPPSPTPRPDGPRPA